MANSIHYKLNEANKFRIDNYPPGVQEHLQNRPFAANENAGAQERMGFMHQVFGDFIFNRLQQFVQQRRADPITQNAPNGYWERILTVATMNKLFDDVLYNFQIRGKDFQDLTLKEIWEKVVDYANRNLDRLCYLWSPKFQIPVGAFNAQQRQEDKNDIQQQGQGKPKKCRKCGLYKH